MAWVSRLPRPTLIRPAVAGRFRPIGGLRPGVPAHQQLFQFRGGHTDPAARRSASSSRYTPSGIRANRGRANALSLARPSRMVRSAWPADVEQVFGQGRGASQSAFKAAAPSSATRVSGSWPSGRNRNFSSRPSRARGSAFSRARHAAWRPARSPSKQNTNSPVMPEDLFRCSWVVAVPSVATAK